MTDVAFHTGLPDKLGYACRLLRRAAREPARVRVIGPDDELQALDMALWTFEAVEFVPHARHGAVRPSPALARTPIWLTRDAAAWPDGVPAPGVLVNLGVDPPDDVPAYAKVVELVGDDAQELVSGRQRWRRYVALGLAPRKVDAPGAV